MDWTFWILGALGVANLVVLLWLLVQRRQGGAAAGALAQLDAALAQRVQGSAERLERALRAEVDRSAQGTRQELAQGLNLFQQTLIAQQGSAARTLHGQLDAFRAQVAAMQQVLADGLQQATQSLAAQGQSARDAQDAALRRFADAQAAQLRELSDANERRLGEVRTTVEHKLSVLATENERKLEQMRVTVDEKLHATLEHRLGESFRQVAERLEQVHRGLGEMQTLARDVGSLHRVLTNVKSRGIFGEVQLAALLEQVFTPEQYGLNVETVPGSGARVEFAIKLPGRRDDGVPLWLPIDAKFPREDYERLLEAQDRADPLAVEAAAKAIEMRLRLEARTIREKYLAPPHTTEFAILFVPTEGLYAEALRRPGLVESLQRESRVTLAGPTTLLATLSSLQMGFRTFALEKRSAEVWEVLGAVKTEFGKFGEVLAKTKKKLDEASKVIDSAEVRTRAMGRKLRAVEALPEAQAQALLPVEPLLDLADEEPA